MMTLRAITPGTIDLVMGAQIVSRPSDGRGTSPSVVTMKAVLLCLSRFDGNVLTLRELSDLVGVCDRSAYLAVRALRGAGLLTACVSANGTGTKGGTAGAKYTVNLEAIRALPRIRGWGITA